MASVALSYETLSKIELARRIAQRDSIAAGLVIKRNNQRLYRAAWSVLKDRGRPRRPYRTDIQGLRRHRELCR